MGLYTGNDTVDDAFDRYLFAQDRIGRSLECDAWDDTSGRHERCSRELKSILRVSLLGRLVGWHLDGHGNWYCRQHFNKQFHKINCYACSKEGRKKQMPPLGALFGWRKDGNWYCSRHWRRRLVGRSIPEPIPMRFSKPSDEEIDRSVAIAQYLETLRQGDIEDTEGFRNLMAFSLVSTPPWKIRAWTAAIKQAIAKGIRGESLREFQLKVEEAPVSPP